MTDSSDIDDLNDAMELVNDIQTNMTNGSVVFIDNNWLAGDFENFSYNTTHHELFVNGTLIVPCGNSTEWCEAYGWGNHSAVGYDTTNDSWAENAGETYTLQNVGIGTS